MVAGYTCGIITVYNVYFKQLKPIPTIKNLFQMGLSSPPVMVHMQCSSVSETAQEDLQPAAQALFSVEDDRGMERRVGTVE